MAEDLIGLLANAQIPTEFTPYVDYSKEADALNVYFKPDADYSKRLTDHVTLFCSLDTHEIVGCRIKGINEILEDLPNYVKVSHDGARLSVLFLSFRGGIQDEQVRNVFNQLAKASEGLKLQASR